LLLDVSLNKIFEKEFVQMIELSMQDIKEILYGCTILGTGGGGSPEKGIRLIEEAFKLGKRFRMVDFSEVPDDAWIATPYVCGSISPTTPELEARYAGLPELNDPLAFLAYKAMEAYIGEPFYGVISTELGGGNTAEAFYTAALMDRFIMDADPAGRSVPELIHSTYNIFDLPIYPISCANQFGDVAVFPQVVDDTRAEALVRALAVASKNSIGVTDHPARAGVLKNAVIRGAISYAWKIGKIFTAALQEGKQTGMAVAAGMNGYVLFRGKLSKHTYDTVDGFTVGDAYIQGEGEFSGSEYHVWYKNEHIASWKDGKVDVMAPDLICIFNDDTNMPNINPHFSEGMNVTVIGLPAPEQWRTQKGLDIFGPRHFGFDFDYEPIEKKHRSL